MECGYGVSEGKEMGDLVMYSPLYRPVALALRVVLGIALVYLLVRGDVQAAFIVGVFLVLSFAYLLREKRRPGLFDVVFLLAALVGAVGYAFDLFTEVVPYDELTHAFATFSVSLAFYFLFYGGAVPRERALALGTSVFTLGVTVGAYWEVFEWFMGNRYGMQDTMTDLIVDGIGALAAALVALVLRNRGERIT
jgi:hypothetical protein